MERRSARPTSLTNQPPGDGYDQELLAVDERINVEAGLEGMDDVSRALDEEPPARVAVRTIGEEASYLSSVERRSSEI